MIKQQKDLPKPISWSFDKSFFFIYSALKESYAYLTVTR